jgi:hypothetical protein
MWLIDVMVHYGGNLVAFMNQKRLTQTHTLPIHDIPSQ